MGRRRGCQHKKRMVPKHPMEEASTQIAVRVGPELYEKIVERQQAAKKLTGIEPSLSATVRAMLEESASSKRKR